MIRIALILIILVLKILPILAQTENELKVRITNIPNTKGTLRICMTANKSDFMKKCLLSKEVAATAKEVTVTFSGVEKGRYAIAVYHDENTDGELTTGRFGIPKEAYGFSNNPKAMFGPPGFDKCSFLVDANKIVNIRL
jgi:uncharacterized protein (DUF2141 family)